MSLKARDIEAGYGGKQVLRGVSLDVGEREIVSLIGHNGAGKSTLLKSIFGLMPGVKGELVWQGNAIRGRAPADNLRDGIVYCPEGAKVFRTLTVRENLELGAFPFRGSKARIRANLPKVLELFPVLARKADTKGGQLSGGERQMLAIGMGLIATPRLAMLDEPSGGLAPLLVEQVFNAIRTIVNEFNTSVLLVEQNIKAAFRVADRVYVMANGAIIDSGSPDDFSRGDRLQQSFFAHGSIQGAAHAERSPIVMP
jgi:branched-chain amino acid transport system ATP-binding protein